jgi:MSHA biogenesis protein MshL
MKRALLLFLAGVMAASAASPSDPLAAPVVAFRAAQVPIETALLTVSRTYGVTFVLEPGLKGEVTLEVRGGTVRDLIDALARSQGFYWEPEGRLIAVRKTALRFYEIDYPQMTRSAEGTSSVVLSAQTGNTSPGTGNALVPAAAGSAGGNAAGLPRQNDQTNLTVQQENQTTFWADVQAELSGLAQPGESVAVNRLAGLAVVTASPARQDAFRDFITLINRRISRQVRISARVLEVSLSDQNQLGVDWALATSKIGGVSLTGLATHTAFATLNGQAFIPSTVSGTIATGNISAVIQALQQQGEVRAVSNPSVVSLSNQTAFVKVGTEQTFFSLANSTSINQAGTATPYAATQNSYSQNAITIGTVLYVTPEVNSDDTVTVDVLPAITQLIGVDTSPDGLQTAPRMDIKALSTLARLHPNQAVMIGGLIYDETSKQTQAVPGLGSLPVVGRLFRTAGGSHARSELVIFLSAELIE